MLKIFHLLFGTALFISSGQCRSLWDADLDEFINFTLQRGKPINLSKNYTEVQICELDGTLYSETFSQLKDVTVLRICRSNFNEIENGGLCSAPALKSLELDFSWTKLPILTKRHFENCGQIEELILKFPYENDTYRIDDDALEDLSNLKKLHIQSYNLSHLDKHFLKVSSSSLISLAFSLTNIHEIDKDTFENFVNLEEIVIIHNRDLEIIPKELFRNNRKLKRLFLVDNSIKDLTFEEFRGLNDLEELILGSNKIINFDADNIAKYLPNLQRLDIQLNPPSCKDKEAFANDLKTKLKHPIEVEYKFDPGFYDSCEQAD